VPTLAPTPRSQTVPHLDALNLLAGEIRRIAQLAAETDKRTPIPACPGWTLADLVEHVARVHVRATRMVRDLAQTRIDPRRIDLSVPADWSEVPAWLQRVGGELVDTLRAADPDAPMYALGKDQHVRSWFRRMLNETTIHRVDVELAAGLESPIEPAVAVDIIDELLDLLPAAASFHPRIRELRGDGETIHLHATDLDGSDLPGEWLITLEPHGFRWSRAHVKGAVAVRGTVQDLALFAYGRRSQNELQVFGDTPLLAHWSANAAL
jgi:uncharacterized protein (TIGR03083 family)